MRPIQKPFCDAYVNTKYEKGTVESLLQEQKLLIVFSLAHTRLLFCVHKTVLEHELVELGAIIAVLTRRTLSGKRKKNMNKLQVAARINKLFVAPIETSG